MTTPPRWTLAVFARVIVKAAIVFAAINLLYALINPGEWLGSLSVYNALVPGRARFPYGEDATQSNNITVENLPAMFASHRISAPTTDDRARVLLIGDSGAWGWLQRNDETIAAALEAHPAIAGRAQIDNLGYPIMSLTKDLLILDEAMRYQPRAIVWLITLESFPPQKQLLPPLVQANGDRLRRLAAAYPLALDLSDPRLAAPSLLDRTLAARRRAIADWLRLQTFGFQWAATGIDQAIPDTFTPRQSDFEVDPSWQEYDEATALTRENLAFDVLAAGIARAGSVPILIVNEPIYVSSGENSAIRYNSWYPRWAYDGYRALLTDEAAARGWTLIDLWDTIAPNEFTDNPVHLTPDGARQTADLIAPALAGMLGGEDALSSLALE